MKSFVEKFKLADHGTDVPTEVLAGTATFLTMAYIVFVNPAILSGLLFGINTGIDIGALSTVTCISAAVGTLAMGLYARYPIALAPGMGGNLLFVFSVLPAARAAGFSEPWTVAMGTVFVAAAFFLLLTFLNINRLIVEAISHSMKNAIAVGIGLFIAFIGLQNAGLIVKDQGTAVKLNASFSSPDFLVFLFGIILIVVLHTRRVRSSILIGIVGTTILSVMLRLAIPSLPASIAGSSAIMESMLMNRFQIARGIFSLPPPIGSTLLHLDITAACTMVMLPFVILYFFLGVLGSVGTAVGICQQGGFIKNNKLPRAERILRVDAAAGVVGALLGTTTVTSYIESTAGVEQGGRTGLASVVTAVLFLVALFISPLITMVGSYPLITAPALVIIGAMMMNNVRRLDWNDYSEVLPAFLVIIGIPLSYSIADGLVIGFVIYPIVKLLSGKRREVHPMMYVISFLLVIFFVFVRSRAG